MSKEPRITDLSLDVLKRFYQVRSNRALIAAMAHHIDKLQVIHRSLSGKPYKNDVSPTDEELFKQVNR